MTGRVIPMARRSRAVASDAGKGAGEAPELTVVEGCGVAGADVG